MATAKKEEVAKTGTELEVTKTGIAAPEFLGADDFGSGFEGTDKESYAIPFLQLLQKMSPLVDEDSPKYVKGAKAGMLYNTVTQKLYDVREKPLPVIPAAYKRTFVLWGGRESDDKGFKGEFTPEQIEAIKDDPEKIKVIDGKYFVPDEDGEVNEKKSPYYADTRSHFVVFTDPETGETGQAIIALSSSQIKASKMLMTSLQQKKVDVPNKGKMTPPTYANVVNVSTVGLTNEKGNWSGIKFDLAGMVTDPSLFHMAKDFYKAIVSGEMKADFSKVDAEDAGNDGGESPQDADKF